MDPGLQVYVEKIIGQFEQIPGERRVLLTRLSHYVESSLRSGEDARLIFICTHNSRRSHMSQIWAHTAAEYYQLPGISTFSGGTEATAFHPGAAAAMERAGFDIEPTTRDENPIYHVKYHAEAPPMKVFSKVFSEDPNPERGFCAIMTCSEADLNCPFVPGASMRISLPYLDPKAYDGSPHEITAYDERCRQIGCEMFYLFSQVP